MTEQVTSLEQFRRFSPDSLADHEVKFLFAGMVNNVPVALEHDAKLHAEQFNLSEKTANKTAHLFWLSNTMRPSENQHDCLLWMHELISTHSGLEYDSKAVTAIEMRARNEDLLHLPFDDRVALLCEKFGLVYSLEPSKLEDAFTVRSLAYDRLIHFYSLLENEYGNIQQESVDFETAQFFRGVKEYYTLLRNALA